jgi:hypothetical protein
MTPVFTLSIFVFLSFSVGDRLTRLAGVGIPEPIRLASSNVRIHFSLT